MATTPFWINRTAFLGSLPGPSRASEQSAARREGVMTNGSLETEALGVERMSEHVRDWAELVSRAIEPNGFLEPGFALPAARHFPAKSRPVFVTVWRQAGAQGGARRLVALFPIVAPGFSLGAATARGWLHKQAALATPLLDRECAEEAAAAILDWFAGSRFGAGAVLIPKTPMSGPVFAAFTRAARATGRDWRVLDRHERAALLAGGDPEEVWTRTSSRKALSEMRRRRRRLEEAGELKRVIYSTPADIPRATEDFLALEASGWKAERGALLGHPSLATFVRSATRLLAREGKIRIHSLELAGKPIAMGVVIESGARSYFWKIAYDESLRAQAPGVQLVYAITETQSERADMAITDSCAIPGHYMIERCWPDRLVVCDLMVQAKTDGVTQFAEAHAKEVWRRRLREAAKTLYHRVLNRKR
ncbi:acyl-CoA acyltransferase [Methylosinus sp. R-45379]|uniref:GNAT family N-acetyltransferase n=1 Tax=unclassified Methylosinus TaxID=2624500 RepID=UPI0004645440|nr:MULTISPECIES: GNAT family N-acetyltransferase [unclassified Methylosinus]OAI29966.1 acyl-CoA acyltransferase [Methylosinus sp. R-45379]TDX65531.1 acetyltransferase (GNAT) family protein [Methylosinus sp. sav-2]